MNSAVLSILISVVVLLLGVAGTFGIRATFQTNRNTQTITNYEVALRSYRERVEAAESSNENLKQEAIDREAKHGTEMLAVQQQAAQDRADCQAQYTELKGRYETLRDLITGAPAVQNLDRLTRQMESVALRFEEAIARFNMVEEQVLGHSIETERPPT